MKLSFTAANKSYCQCYQSYPASVTADVLICYIRHCCVLTVRLYKASLIASNWQYSWVDRTNWVVAVFTRDSIYAITRQSVHMSVCQTVVS